MELDKLKTRMEEIAGNWNGDEPGRLEDRAHIANEILQCIDEIENLLQELSES